VEAAAIVRQLLIRLQTMQQVAAEPVVQQVLLVLAVLRALQVHLALRVRPALLELVALLAQVEAVVQVVVVGKPSKSCCFISFSKKNAPSIGVFFCLLQSA
jgi:hypothetical protein